MEKFLSTLLTKDGQEVILNGMNISAQELMKIVGQGVDKLTIMIIQAFIELNLILYNQALLQLNLSSLDSNPGYDDLI